MEAIKIKPTDVSPEVILDPANKKFSISGWSRPESPSKFYAPIIKWIDENGAAHLGNATVEFRIEYFNTPSARVLREILDQFEKLYKKGIQIKINWYFDDESAKEEFEYEFAQGLTIPINFISKE
jgi:SiaC family regulatory phosphoprotein